MSRVALRTLRGTALWAVPLAAVAFYTSIAASPADTRVVVNFFISLILVLGIQSFSGNSGILTFGHLAFAGVGAYCTAILTIPEATKSQLLPALPGFLAHAQLGFVPAILISSVVAGAVAGVLGVALSRMRANAMAMATFGILVIFFVVFESWDQLTRGPEGLYGIPQDTTLFAAVAAAIIVLALARLYRESNIGLRLRATREDDVAAGTLGIDVIRSRHGAWIVSGAIMGIGGALFAQYTIAFGPREFYFTETFALLAMLVVGGIATTSGAVVGAVVVTLLNQILGNLSEGFSVGPLHVGAIGGLAPIVIAVLILVILRTRQEGLTGTAEVDDSLARWRTRVLGKAR